MSHPLPVPCRPPSLCSCPSWDATSSGSPHRELCVRAFPVRLPARDTYLSRAPEFPSWEPPVPSPGLFGDSHAGPAWGCPDRSSQRPEFPSRPSASPVHVSLQCFLWHFPCPPKPSFHCCQPWDSLCPRCPPASLPGQAGAGTHLPAPFLLATSLLGTGNCFTSIPAAVAPATEKPVAAALPSQDKQPPGSGTLALAPTGCVGRERSSMSPLRAPGSPLRAATACQERAKYPTPVPATLRPTRARLKAIGEPAPGLAGSHPQPLPCLTASESHGGSSPLAPRVCASWPGPGSCSHGMRHPGSSGAAGTAAFLIF